MGCEGEVDEGMLLLGGAVGGEVDVVLVDSGEVIEDEVGIGLYPQHVVERLLVEVLDDYEELVPQEHPLALPQRQTHRLPLPHLLLVDALMHYLPPATDLQHYLRTAVPFLHLGGVVDADPLQFQAMLVDEVSVGGVVDQIPEEGVLVLVGGSLGLETDPQLLVDVVDGLGDVLEAQRSSHEEIAGEEDRTPHLPLLAVHVDLPLPPHRPLHLPDGQDQLVEGQVVIQLEVQVLQLPFLIPLHHPLPETVLVVVLADVPHCVGAVADVHTYLLDVGQLREVHVEDVRHYLRYCYLGRSYLLSQLVVVARQVGNQLGRGEALQHRIQ